MANKAISAQQMQRFDRYAIDVVRIPSLILMENAGRSVADEIICTLKKSAKKRVCVVCGVGNNAGDGFVVARHLINNGVSTQVFFLGKESGLKEDALVNYRILKRLKYPVVRITRAFDVFKKHITRADIIVDALFGIGLNRTLKEPYSSVIDAINKARTYVVSVDVPSGLDATTGDIYGCCIKAKKTVTFSFIKKGLLKRKGPSYSGAVVVGDIGAPQSLIKKVS